VWARRGGLSGERAGPKQFEDMKRVLDEHHRKRSSVSRPAPVLWTRPFLSWAPPKTAAWIAFGFFIISISTLFIMGIFVGAGTDTQFDNLATALSGERGASQAPTSVQGPDCRVDLSGFERLTPGMSYTMVAGQLGCPGREMSHSEHMGFSTAMYAWDGEGERALMSVLFQNDALAQKTQFGLK
jgi:hypothetical protein